MTKKTPPVISIMDLFAKVSELELKNFDGDLTGLKLKMVGTDSKQYRTAEKKMFPFAGRKITELKPDEIEAIANLKQEMVLSFVIGWNNDDAFGGPFSPEALKALLEKEEAKFIRDQIEEFASQRANFFQPGKK
jgi:hypothetical protein